jgi:hypothetical protein
MHHFDVEVGASPFQKKEKNKWIWERKPSHKTKSNIKIFLSRRP